MSAAAMPTNSKATTAGQISRDTLRAAASGAIAASGAALDHGLDVFTCEGLVGLQGVRDRQDRRPVLPQDHLGLVEQFGGTYYALASYNAGEGRVVHEARVEMGRRLAKATLDKKARLTLLESANDFDRAAAELPSKGTIAHGFLTLSLLPMMTDAAAATT